MVLVVNPRHWEALFIVIALFEKGPQAIQVTQLVSCFISKRHRLVTMTLCRQHIVRDL